MSIGRFLKTAYIATGVLVGYQTAASSRVFFTENRCAPRAALVANLERDFHERQFGYGPIGSAVVVEIFMSEDGSTWTVIGTGTDGYSCLYIAGTDWGRGNPPALSETKEDSSKVVAP